MRARVPAPDTPLYKPLETLTSHEDVDIIGHPKVPVLTDGHSTDHRVHDTLGLQTVSQSPDGCSQITPPHEELRRFPES